MNSIDESPFRELPASLVQELLDRTKNIGAELLDSFEDLRSRKTAIQQELQGAGLSLRDNELPLAEVVTSCGVDGSYAVERMLAIDLTATGAVAVEGLTPPSETRYWPEPQHHVYVDTEIHNADTSSILRGNMIGMELILAVNAPHDVVFLDGSLTTPTIFFNQALSKVNDAPTLKVSSYLLKNISEYLRAYRDILLAQRTDHYWIAAPKYSTRQEIGQMLNVPPGYDDRGLLSTILEPGFFTKPLPLTAPKSPWHISTEAVPTESKIVVEKLVSEVVALLAGVEVVYYKPYSWLPALRLEMSRSITQNRTRLSTVLQAVKHQCGTAAILEPYPLYMADRMVKHLSKSIPAFRQIASQYLSETYQGDVGDIFTNLHGYRTETGL